MLAPVTEAALIGLLSDPFNDSESEASSWKDVELAQRDTAAPQRGAQRGSSQKHDSSARTYVTNRSIAGIVVIALLVLVIVIVADFSASSSAADDRERQKNNLHIAASEKLNSLKGSLKSSAKELAEHAVVKVLRFQVRWEIVCAF